MSDYGKYLEGRYGVEMNFIEACNEHITLNVNLEGKI